MLATDGQISVQRRSCWEAWRGEETAPTHLHWDSFSADVCTYPIVTFHSLVLGDICAFAWATGGLHCFSGVQNSPKE